MPLAVPGSAMDVEMREGQWKIRFDCRWTVNRRTMDDWDPANGYQLFTNFGGSETNLLPGGANLEVTDTGEGIFTVTVRWDPSTGFTVTREKTDDVVPIDFIPDEHQWGIIGDATPSGWDS